MTSSTGPAQTPIVDRDAADVMDRRLAWIVVLACAAFVIVGLGRSLIGLSSFSSSDILSQYAPWAAHVDPAQPPHNPFVGDPIDGVLPAMHEFVSRLWHGDWASWTSLEGGGMALGAVPNLGVLSPIALPFLVLPIWLAPAYAKLLEIAVAVAGMYLFARRLGLSRSAGWLGGLAFATSGFLIAWTNWPQTRTAAFIPAVFWAVERLIQRPSGRSVGVVALTVAAILAGGFPSVTAYALYTATVYLVVRLLVHGVARSWLDRLRRTAVGIALATAGLVGGVSLLALQLLPFVHQLGVSFLGDRQQTPDDFLPLTMLVTIISPDALGTPASHASWHGPRNPIESFSYGGMAVVVLACIGVVAGFSGRIASRRDQPDPLLAGQPSRPIERFSLRAFFLLAAIGWGIAIYAGGHVLATVQQLPELDSNAIGRARSIVGFLIAVLAAAGFDALVRRRAAGRARPGSRWSLRHPDTRVIADLIVATTALTVFGIAAAELVRHAATYADAKGFADSYRAHVLTAALFGAVAMVGAGLARWGPRRWQLVGAAMLPVVVLAQAATVVTMWWPQVPREDVYPVTATHDFLAEHLGHDRFLPIEQATLPGTNLSYGVRSLSGHVYLRDDFADLIATIDPDSFVAPTLPEPHLPAAIAAPRLLDRLGVRYLVAAPEEPVVGDREIEGAGGATVPWASGVTLRVAVDNDSLRGVGVVLTEPFPHARATITATVFDAAGNVLATGARYVEPGQEAGELVVPIAGEDLPAAARVVELTYIGGTPLMIDAAAADDPTVVVITPADDGLKLVQAGESTIYERETALSRIRWAGTSEVDPDASRTISALADGTAAGVVLVEPGPVAAGSTATVDVLEDSGDTIRARVDADGPGYLVVADSLLDTFKGSVDGSPAPLRQADHGYVAVAVPTGVHEVTITYANAGGMIGPVTSGFAAVVVLALVIVDPGRRASRGWRRRRAVQS